MTKIKPHRLLFGMPEFRFRQRNKTEPMVTTERSNSVRDAGIPIPAKEIRQNQWLQPRGVIPFGMPEFRFRQKK